MLAHWGNMAVGSNCHVDDSYIESKYTVYKAISTNPRHRERIQPAVSSDARCKGGQPTFPA